MVGSQEVQQPVYSWPMFIMGATVGIVLTAIFILAAIHHRRKNNKQTRNTESMRREKNSNYADSHIKPPSYRANHGSSSAMVSLNTNRRPATPLLLGSQQSLYSQIQKSLNSSTAEMNQNDVKKDSYHRTRSKSEAHCTSTCRKSSQ